MVGVPVCLIFYIIFTIIKNKSEKYQNFFTPCLVSLCWCCVIFPFIVVLPFMVSSVDNTTNDFAQIMKVTIVSVSLVCIMGVTSFSIFFHIILGVKKKF
jgi:hypothetical protein